VEFKKGIVEFKKGTQSGIQKPNDYVVRKEPHPLDESIDFLIETLAHLGDYTTLIVGILQGDEETVKATEKKFDRLTDELDSANGFIKLSNFKRKEGNTYW